VSALLLSSSPLRVQTANSTTVSSPPQSPTVLQPQEPSFHLGPCAAALPCPLHLFVLSENPAEDQAHAHGLLAQHAASSLTGNAGTSSFASQPQQQDKSVMEAGYFTQQQEQLPPSLNHHLHHKPGVILGAALLLLTPSSPAAAAFHEAVEHATAPSIPAVPDQPTTSEAPPNAPSSPLACELDRLTSTIITIRSQIACSHPPTAHGSFTAACSHSPTAHGSFTAACSHPPTAHGSFTAACSHPPTAHGSFTAACSHPPTTHGSFTAACSHSPTAHGSFTAACSHPPTAHGSFTAACGLSLADATVAGTAGASIQIAAWRDHVQPLLSDIALLVATYPDVAAHMHFEQQPYVRQQVAHVLSPLETAGLTIADFSDKELCLPVPT